jgi:hypothetical protein
MITAHLADSKYTIRPEQLNMLQRVFDRACTKARIRKNTPQAEGLAATLLHLFQTGTEEEDQLVAMLDRIEFL